MREVVRREARSERRLAPKMAPLSVVVVPRVNLWDQGHVGVRLFSGSSTPPSTDDAAVTEGAAEWQPALFRGSPFKQRRPGQRWRTTLCAGWYAQSSTVQKARLAHNT